MVVETLVSYTTGREYRREYKPISNELYIIIHVIASPLSGHCDVISNRLWRRQQNENQANGTRECYVNIVVFIVISVSVMSWNK